MRFGTVVLGLPAIEVNTFVGCVKGSVVDVSSVISAVDVSRSTVDDGIEGILADVVIGILFGADLSKFALLIDSALFSPLKVDAFGISSDFESFDIPVIDASICFFSRNIDGRI